MPINAFGGGPGSGKTYGVMEHVILPAIAKGRFVLTNIDGLAADEIYEYVAQNFYKGKIICIGHIRRCDRNAPSESGFFPGEAQLDQPCPVPSPEQTRVVGGDLVVIDEATRYWPTGERVSREHQFFFREHRHFTNEVGDSCDLVVIDPDLTQLSRPLKGKIELSSVTHKLKELGLERYVVNLYRGGKITAKPMQTNGPYPFDKKIYSLYKSYSHEKAKEQVIDKRQNLFNGRYFRVIVPLAILGVVGGIYSTVHFFSKAQKPAEVAHSDKPNATAVKPPVSSGPSISDRWRGSGYVASDSGVTFYISDGDKTRSFEKPTNYKLFRRSFEVRIGDTWVTDYSGPSSRSSGLGRP